MLPMNPTSHQLRRLGLRAALSGAFALTGALSAAACDPEVEWRRVLEVAGTDTRLAGLEPWGEDDLAVGAWLRPTDAASPEDFSSGYWRVNAAGEVPPLVRVPRLAADASTAGGQVSLTGMADLAVLGGDRLFAAAEGLGGRAVLLEIGDGDVRFAKTLPVGAGSHLLRLVALSGGDLLGLGQQSQALAARSEQALAQSQLAMALVLTDRGEIRRRWIDRLGPLSRYLDALEQAGGDLVLLANAGTYDLMMRGPSKVVLRRLGSDGAVLREVSFPGRYGDLAALAGGRIAVIYDQADTRAQDIVLQLYTADLELLWEKPVAGSAEGLARFGVAGLPDGTILVAGGKDGWPYSAVYDLAGKRQWESWDRDDPTLGQEYRMLARGGAVYVAASSFVAAGGRDFLQKIHLSKLVCGLARTDAGNDR
jgi:hypothetical protein